MRISTFIYIYFSYSIIMNDSKCIKTAEKLCVDVTSISLFIFIIQPTLIMKVRNQKLLGALNYHLWTGCIFIHGLFSYTFSISDYVVLNEGFIQGIKNCKRCERKYFWPKLKKYLSILLEGMIKTASSRCMWMLIWLSYCITVWWLHVVQCSYDLLLTHKFEVEKVDTPVTWLTCFQEVPSSNLSQFTGCPQVFYGFLPSI